MSNKVKVALEQAMKTQKGRSGIALLFNIVLSRGGWLPPRHGRFSPGRRHGTIVYEAGWAPGPLWTGAENLAPTGSLSPGRPAS
jgi:hypothetical protein